MLHRKVILFPLVLLGLGLIAACGSSSVEKTIFVAPQKVECVGVAPQECLLIKEDAEDDWQFWYDSIEGFEYEPGLD